MSLKAFNLCFNNHSTFLLFSQMLNEVEAVCPPLSTLFGMRLRTNRYLNDASHVRSHSNKSVSVVTTAVAAWDRIPDPSWTPAEAVCSGLNTLSLRKIPNCIEKNIQSYLRRLSLSEFSGSKWSFTN